ncbi:IclR family transcriptional regulator [Achromobacter aloeverae]|uniref:IclR family transcriptional regulator n=1 Tax=Achromobacter aloeverae TaxID=1750518 RepID=A0A4V1MRJ0_9BURK|nr:IclR family transcriptional regulator [Achromobacter aloeverae]RXN84484.1 IclR family transcriptional regulator [Achromobacter aloeverae]
MSIKQVGNVLDLLEYFAGRQRPASLAEIARHFGWPRSSTFNLLLTLTNRGFLYEPRARAGYYPAPVWAELITQIERGQPIPHGMRALLDQLVQETGETAVLAAASGAHALFIETVESPSAVRYAAPVGKRVPLHVTATGRALLSQMSAADRAAILEKAAYERYTDTTRVSAEQVEAEIAASIARGWFEGNAEYTQDLGGVAMPFAVGERRYALLVAGPMFRVASRLPELAQRLRERLEGYLAAQAAGE